MSAIGRGRSGSSPGFASLDLSGKVAMVTGAGNPDGIGFHAARVLRRRGAAVAISATTSRVEERAEELGALGLVADLTDWDSTAALFATVEGELGPIDVLVNNAGLTQVGAAIPVGEVAGQDPAAWERIVDVNLHTTFRSCRAVAAGMIERGGGRIVNVSSVTGPLVAQAGVAAYAAAKAGVDGLTRALALELGSHGITVNSVAPGWIDTGSMSVEERRAATQTALGRAGRPAEVGELIAFLASAAASYVTGQSLVVDGGNVIQEIKR